MTSSNVANLLVKPNAKDLMPKQKLQPEVKSTGDLFAKTLQNVSGLTRTQETTPTPKASDKSGGILKTEVENTTEKEEILQGGANRPDMTDPVEKVEAVVKEVKEVIEEELDVTDEEIELVMENLGLLNIDLLDPQNLVQLVTELTGQEDSISLVMSEEFANILEDVTDLTNQLLENIDNTLPEIKEFLIQMEPQGENPVVDMSELDVATDVIEEGIPAAQSEMPKEEVIQEETSATDSIKPDEVIPVKADEKAEPNTSEDETVVEEAEEPMVVQKKTENKDTDSEKREFTPDQKQEKPILKTNENNAPVIKNDHVNPMMQTTQEIQFSAQNQVVELPTGETVKASDIVNQFIEQAKVLTTTESTTMELTLNPEGLGKIYLEVTQKGNEITAKIFTENDAVKQALESQMANLKTEFNQNSTKVTSIEVSVGTHEFERNLDEKGREDSRRDEAREQSSKRRGRIDITSLDDLSGLMSDEEMLIAQMMRDNGGTLDFMA